MLYERLHDWVCGAPGEWDLRHCPNGECGLIWLDPMPTEDDIGKAYPASYYTHASEPRMSLLWRAYTAIGDGYLQRRLGYQRGVGQRWYRYLGYLAWLYPPADAEFGFGALYLPWHPDRRRLLEVGCGSGEALSRMQRMGWEVEGVDLDPLAVENACAKGLPVRLGELASQQYPDNSFDAIFMGHVIEHVHDPIGLLRESRRILKVGGKLVILTPNVNSWGHRRFGRAWLHLDPPRHLMLFGLRTLERIVKDAQLRIERLVTSTRGATDVWLRSKEIQRGSPPRASRLVGPIPWLRALPYQVDEQSQLRSHPEIGEELLLMASK